MEATMTPSTRVTTATAAIAIALAPVNSALFKAVD
jgi:hypothetical protein